jgi:thymidylate kinase
MHRFVVSNFRLAPPITMSSGHLVIHLLAALEAAGLPAVYLRNYEALPDFVGNDVDLLVPAGKRSQALKVLIDAAREEGWEFLSKSCFSPIALYLASVETAETLHFDIFDRLEWHFIEFADAARIIGNKRRHRALWVPAQEDEIYLNLVTRLAYQGNIREKHRVAARSLLHDGGSRRLRETFVTHLGSGGAKLYDRLLERDWNPQSADRRVLLFSLVARHGFGHPSRLIVGIGRYLFRSVRKLIRPPGKLVVLEGADGVGKSTVLDAIRPWCGQWCAGRDTYGFHWKPVKVRKHAQEAAPVDPRSSTPRAFVPSLIFLAYHLLGFWWGWIFKIRPLLVRSHAVVGDRYGYDLYMDPARFRLGLPSWVCELAARSVPGPSVTVGLTADPHRVYARKPELTVDDIANYQDRWAVISKGRSTMVSVDANDAPEQVAMAVKRAILRCLISRGR